MHDVLLVLGYSTDRDHPIFQSRVRKAAELFDQGLAAQIIMSGCCSDKLDIKPKRTEAACMRDYAVELGISPSVILLEEASVDTLGNFYFSKKNILLACNWFNVGVVSTPWHLYRSQWLAEMVLGPEFDITGYPADHPLEWTEDDVSSSERYNEQLLEDTRELLKNIAPGDHEAIAPFLGVPPK